MTTPITHPHHGSTPLELAKPHPERNRSHSQSARPDFAAMLDGHAEESSVTAASFQGTGLFGRRAFEHETAPAACLNAKIADEQQKYPRIEVTPDRYEAPPNKWIAPQHILDAPEVAHVPTRRTSTSLPILDSAVADTLATGVSQSEPVDKSSQHSQTEEALHRYSARASRPSTPLASIERARAQMSGIYLSFHSTESEPRVYARAGRMEPTERARLRYSMRVLLAEYGMSDATIILVDYGDSPAERSERT